MRERKALLYCRVSSKSQELDGHGLDSQQVRCENYAESKGYSVEAVFPDTFTGGGEFTRRPGMVALLAYIDAQPNEEFVIVIDDLKRMSRDTRAFLDLRDAFRIRGARVESPNFTFEETPEGEFVETVIAAQGALERKQNGRQVKQKMNVRTELGFWCHKPPIGYRFDDIKGQGKTVVRDEPIASVVQQALEGYASGLYQTQAEVQRLLNDDPRFPRGKSGRVGPERVSKLLTKPFYAGYFSSEAYGLKWHKMQHEPLISLETYQKIQDRRAGVAKAPKRANIGDEFVLRGIVACACCGTPLRSYFAKGRHGGRFPYYMCGKKGCEQYGKSTKRDTLEGEVGELIKALEPTPKLMRLAAAMFKAAWDSRGAQAAEIQRAASLKIKAIDNDIDAFLDRVVATKNRQVINRYEEKVAELEYQKAVLAEKQGQKPKSLGSFEEKIEPLMQLLANPWKLWESGSIHARRLVLRLAFAERISYCRNEGVRTPEIAFPFKALGSIGGGELVSGGA